MDNKLENFFCIDNKAFYINKSGEMKFRGVNHYYGDTVRNDKADEQAKLPPVPYNTVFTYINDFLELIRFDNNKCNKINECRSIELDGLQQIILDNGILAVGCKWEEPIFDEKKKMYTFYDKKYDTIRREFNLSEASDIVWLKFTTNGHLGVVAKSFDINFRDDNSSGKLVQQVGEEWDKSFVFIFPLTYEILAKHSTDEVELGIGKFLASKNVPIIDFYSHNN